MGEAQATLGAISYQPLALAYSHAMQMATLLEVVFNTRGNYWNNAELSHRL